MQSDDFRLLTDISYARANYPFEITKGSTDISYLYSADDQRIYKETQSVSDTTKEYYLKNIGILDIEANNWTWYVNGADRVAKITPAASQQPKNIDPSDLTLNDTLNTSFYLYDHLGNTRVVYNPDVKCPSFMEYTVEYAGDYYPYGKTLRAFTSTPSEKFLTTQHERDQETGLDYRGARFYDSDMGRFLSLDPLASNFANLSPYNYVGGNPISLVDSDGKSPKPYPGKIQEGINRKQKWAYTAAALFDTYFNQVSFSRMDRIEGHSNRTFNSYHFARVVGYYETNAKRELDGNRGEGPNDWKQCSPSMYYGINRLYNWSGSDKIKSGYVLDYEDPNTGAVTKGIVTLMREKGLVGSSNTFVGVDEGGTAAHYSGNEAVDLDQSIANWAENQTEANGVGVFLVAVSGGYHSLTLVVDRRGKSTEFRLLDQHGNGETGSSSSFDRTIPHSAYSIDNHMLKMLQSWGEGQSNFNIQLYQLKRD